MTKQEAMKLLYVVKATYIRHFDKATTNDISNLADAWVYALDGWSYEEAAAGLKAYLANDRDGFPPVPGQIIGYIRKAQVSPAQETTAAEAWDQVYKAICNLSWDEPEKEFDKLPEISRKVIGTAAGLREIAAMDIDSVMIGEKARFIHAYNAYKKDEVDYYRIPQDVRGRLSSSYGRNTKELEFHDERKMING